MRNRERSILKNIPISELSLTMRFMKAHLTNKKLKLRIVYRGPRSNAIGDTRSPYTRQSSCLKRFATSFALYNDTRPEAKRVAISWSLHEATRPAVH